ncbi:iron (metal) dependent repressor, DtxR family [Sporobacter termitidis DSM 10068]|uniref:Manganese transport regulator n=1 Tax=Sporobacter termitidis DSM 10068 TaxID=1123282 RepID=A0A1M5YRQ0_9FIRM|nr:metal-dependent transcriptional regulator [Sporobacter termitidis]SHI14732.1 iron (metal) dependent repressor, DtxR family [Sporobacter termitidis DSM 10068]
MTDLTPSQQHYIKAIYMLSSSREGTRICDVAERLAVTKSSVCVAMKTLQRMNLVERDFRHQILLTPEGKEQAVLIVDRLAIIKCFLVEALHITVDAAELDACAMEHAVSRETLCAMCRHVNYTARKCVCSLWT